MQIKTKIVSCHTANPKPVKQEVNGTVIHPPLVFPDQPLLILQTLFTFLAKQATLMRRSTVLSLPPQLVFPALVVSLDLCYKTFYCPNQFRIVIS